MNNVNVNLSKIPLHVLQQRQEQIEYDLDHKAIPKRDVLIKRRLHSEITNEIIARRKAIRQAMAKMAGKGMKIG